MEKSRWVGDEGAKEKEKEAMAVGGACALQMACEIAGLGCSMVWYGTLPYLTDCIYLLEYRKLFHLFPRVSPSPSHSTCAP